jgi:lipopolysaccharide export system protein LptA
MIRFHKGFFILLFAATQAWALPEDNTQSMHITADSTLFNYKSGFNVYEGNVSVTQGETRLTADKLTTQSNDKHKIEVAIAYGLHNPAHYWTIPKIGDAPFHARAQTIKFFPQKSNVILDGNALVTQGNNSFHGAEIIYNIKDQIVSSPATKKGRSTIIIEPAKLNS